MIRDSSWRSLLIRLFDRHQESSLLGYCIKKMSALGHLQEIAKVLKGADYYDVFSDILLDRVSTITSVDDLAKRNVMLEVRRICSSSEYAYLFLQEFIAALKHKLASSAANEHKIRESDCLLGYLTRFLQESEKAIIWDKYRGKDDEAASSLDSRGVNALKLTPFYNSKVGLDVPKANELKNEVFKILKDNCAYQVMVQRVCGMYFDNFKDDVSKTNLIGKLEKISLPAGILRHYQASLNYAVLNQFLS